MRRLVILALPLYAALFAVTLTGCSGRTGQEPEASSFDEPQLAPRDGALGVALNEPVVLRFNGAVDRAVVAGNLFVWSEDDMPDSVCTFDSTSCGHDMEEMGGMMGGGGHGGAMHAGGMHNSHMQGSDPPSIPGTFEWDSSSMQVTFRPDQPWSPGTRYGIHFRNQQTALLIAHFRTAEAGGTGDEHSGHH